MALAHALGTQFPNAALTYNRKKILNPKIHRFQNPWKNGKNALGCTSRLEKRWLQMQPGELTPFGETHFDVSPWPLCGTEDNGTKPFREKIIVAGAEQEHTSNKGALEDKHLQIIPQSAA